MLLTPGSSDGSTAGLGSFQKLGGKIKRQERRVGGHSHQQVSIKGKLCAVGAAHIVAIQLGTALVAASLALLAYALLYWLWLHFFVTRREEPDLNDVAKLREYLPLGQRVEGFALDVWRDRKWIEVATGTSVGNCRLVRVQPVTTSKVRLRITKAPVCPAISELGLFLEPRER